MGQQPTFLTTTTSATNRGGDFFNFHQQQQQFQLQQQALSATTTNYYQNQAALLEATNGPAQQQHTYAIGNTYANAIESAAIGVNGGLPPSIYACEWLRFSVLFPPLFSVLV